MIRRIGLCSHPEGLCLDGAGSAQQQGDATGGDRIRTQIYAERLGRHQCRLRSGTCQELVDNAGIALPDDRDAIVQSTRGPSLEHILQFMRSQRLDDGPYHVNMTAWCHPRHFMVVVALRIGRIEHLGLVPFSHGAQSPSGCLSPRPYSAAAPAASAIRRLRIRLRLSFCVSGLRRSSHLPADSWLSSVIVGRSVATLAELCFVGQWALMLREVSRASGSAVAEFASLAVVPLIALAEACSWYSVLTTSNLGHIAEESIWGLSAALMVASMAMSWPRCAAGRHPLLVACCVAGVAYVAFMLFVDVPMYWMRWVADESVGRHYMSIAQGFRDVAGRWVSLPPLGRLEGRSGLDVALFQRRRVAQHLAHPCTGARGIPRATGVLIDLKIERRAILFEAGARPALPVE